MCSTILGTGANSLLRVSRHTTALHCLKRVLHTTPQPCAAGFLMPPLRGVGKRLKSSAAPSETVQQERVGKEGGDSSFSTGKKTVSRGQADGRNKKFKILLIDSPLDAKSLSSEETPVLHHALEEMVVCVREHHTSQQPAFNRQSVDEVHITVDQLLRDSKKSIHAATQSQESSNRPREPELVGALPPGALDWKLQVVDLRKLGSYYAQLSKSRLTGLVVVTAVAGYAMAPAPLELSTLVLSSLGIGLVSSAANAVNQCLEVPYDAQMKRTKNRILVRGLISPLHAISFAIVCSTTGIGILYFGANGLAAALGTVNLLLYTSVYTPMKRLTILNTWIGAIVGAIPPLIGWASCVGELGAGAWLMAAILYAWQFPHFNALSWNLRPDYSRAGYRMMSVTDPGLCRRVTLRYSVAMIGICTLAPILDVTTWTFAADSLPFNAYLVYLAWKFHQDADSNSSRKLFLFTLIHLPVIMMLMIISKKHYGKNKNSEAISTSSDVVEVTAKSQMVNTLTT